MPLFIQENYLGATSLPPKPKPMVMRAYADAADAISYGDLIKVRFERDFLCFLSSTFFI